MKKHIKEIENTLRQIKKMDQADFRTMSVFGKKINYMIKRMEQESLKKHTQRNGYKFHHFKLSKEIYLIEDLFHNIEARVRVKNGRLLYVDGKNKYNPERDFQPIVDYLLEKNVLEEIP